MGGRRLQDNKKKTYPDFLREIEMPTEGIIPLGFRFGTESEVHRFHFGLMDTHLNLALFDCVGCRAVACVLKEDADKCREIAKSLGGDEFSVGLML